MLIEILFYLVVLTVLVLFIRVLWVNVKADLMQKELNPSPKESSTKHIFLRSEHDEIRRNEVLFTDLNRYLSLIAIFTALAICIIIHDASTQLFEYLIEIINERAISLGAAIISFFLGGFYYAKAIILQYRKTQMGTIATQARSRAIVSAFLSFATFSLILNLRPLLQQEQAVLKYINLSFVAGMGTFIVYEKVPVISSFINIFSKRKNN